MTMRDFELIADVVKNVKDASVRKDLAYKFADRLDAANPNFKPARFLSACDAPLRLR